MYYRVAIQLDPSSLWQWKSSILSSLDTLFQWPRLYHALSYDRLRVFSSCSREAMNEQLVRENQGLESTSVMAAQFLQERMINLSQVNQETSAYVVQANRQTTSITVITKPSPGESSKAIQTLEERSVSMLDKRREELERGTGGDHDIPYQFALPMAMPQVLAWTKLLVRMHNSDLQP